MHKLHGVLAVWLLLPSLASGDAGGKAFKGGTFEPARQAPELALPGSHGSTVAIDDYRGKVVALAFGFTHCARVCPVTLSNLALVSKQLGKAAGELQVVFVTVDPERDSAKRLREYLGHFNPSFVGATGTAEQLAAVRQRYGITIHRDEATRTSANYQVHHSSSIFLIDRHGKLRVAVPFGKPAQDILHDVKLLLD